MQVTETLKDGLKRSYTITVPAAVLDAKVSDKLAEAQPEIEMKGFRKGKVPMALLRKQYGERLMGDAMQDACIFDGDTLIVDRSVKLVNGRVIVAILNGELLVRRFHKNFSSAFLIAENSRYKNINLAEFSDFAVWGVITYVIHPMGV